MEKITNFYTTLEEAKKEIWRRWNDPVLKKKVENFLGSNFPEPLKSGPRAVTVRCIASPDNEFFNFINESKKIELKPLFIEYPEDKFIAKNSDKYSLCILHFEKDGIKSYEESDKIKLINFNIFEGKSFNKIETLWGCNLVNFHHEIFRRSISEQIEIYNFWNWFNETRYKTEYYYLYYLSLFVCHGILFENILMSEEEREFTEKKIIPSLKKIEEIFGLKPLICPITPIDEEDNFRWWLYPEKVKSIASNYIKEL